MTEPLIKTDGQDYITYTVGTVEVKLWKDTTQLRFEITAPWPVSKYSNWEEYAKGIEDASI